MLNLRMAKSIMEQEDGMNHLWIQFLSEELVTIEKAEVCIELPSGLHRTPNLNSYVENETGCIVLNLSHDTDILLEIYTQTAVDFDEARIVVTLRFQDSENQWKQFNKDIYVHFVSEEELEGTLELDLQVIERVKELRTHAAEESNSVEFVIIQPRTYDHTDNEYAYLEKKYRVDYL